MSGGVPAGGPCCGALPVDWADDPYRVAPTAEIERTIERMRADPFPDDAHLLGTTQQDARMEHYARVCMATPTPPIKGRDADVERVRITMPMIDAALDAEWATDAGGDVPAIGLSYSLREALEEFGANLSTREIENAMHTALSAALNPPSGNEWAISYDREGPR